MQLGHTRVALFPRKGWVCGRRNRVAGHAHCLTLGAPSHRPDLSDACVTYRCVSVSYTAQRGLVGGVCLTDKGVEGNIPACFLFHHD